MSDNKDPSKEGSPSNEVIDLSSTYSILDDVSKIPSKESNVITPSHKAKCNVIDDISKAIASRSFSAMCPQVDNHFDLTDPSGMQSIVTPTKESEPKLNNDVETELMKETLLTCPPDITNIPTHSLVENDSYYLSKPLLKEMKHRLFNDTFIDFFSELKKQDKKEKLRMELLKVRITDHDDVSYAYYLIIYTKNRQQHNIVFEMYDQYDRSLIPTLIVTTDICYENLYDEDDRYDREVMSLVSVDSNFERLL